MGQTHILVVDDDDAILELTRRTLAAEGHDVSVARSAEEALERVSGEVLPDLIVLDLMLPVMDGFEVCRRLRAAERTSRIPVVMLTARDAEMDIVRGLELGADDYVTKPFSIRVLAARVSAVLRRQTTVSDDEQDVTIGALTIRPGRREATVEGSPLTLTRSEFSLLHLLARRPGWVFTRSQIVQAVQGPDAAVTDRSVDVHVASLRKKLGSFAEQLETIRGVGYRLHPPD